MEQRALDKLYADGKFNHLGGCFRPGKAIKPNAHALNLPDRQLDRKRLKQKDLAGRTFDTVFHASVLEEVQSEGGGGEYDYYDDAGSSPSPGAKDYYRTTGITFDIPTHFKPEQARPVSPQTLQANSSGVPMARDFTQRSNIQVGASGARKPPPQQNQLYSKAQITSRFANQKQKRQMVTQQAHPGLLNRTFNQTS